MKISFSDLTKNSFYLFASGISNMFLNMFQSVIVARGLGVSQLGTWAIIVSYCSLTQSLLSFRTQEPLTRYLVKFRQNQQISEVKLLLSTAVITDFLSNFFTLILVVTLSPFITANLSGRNIFPILVLYAGSLVFNSLDKTWFCIARDQRQLSRQSIKQFLITFFKFFSILVLYFSGHLDLHNLALVFFAASFLSSLIICYLLNNELIKGYNLRISELDWKNYLNSFTLLNEFWKFMKATFISNIFSSLIKNLDILLLGHYATTKEVGLYQVSKSLASIGRLAVQSLSSTVYQELSELVTVGKFLEVKQQLLMSIKLSLPKSSILSLLVAIAAHPFIRIFYGDNYLPAYPLFLILFAGIFASINLFWAQATILALDLYKYNLRVIAFSSFFSIISMTFMIPKWSGVGASLAASFSSFLIISSLTIKTFLELNKKIREGTV